VAPKKALFFDIAFLTEKEPTPFSRAMKLLKIEY